VNFHDFFEGLRAMACFDNAAQLITSRLLFRRNPVSIYRMGGRSIVIDHSGGDATGTRMAIASTMYRRLLPRMRLDVPVNLLDLGANGGFPLMLSIHGVALRRCVCVELNPKTFARLTFNVRYNIDCAFKGWNVAVCGEPRDFELYLGTGSTSDSIWRMQRTEGARKVTIPGMTLDDIYGQSFEGETVDICKIDVEGAEHEIFETPHHQCLRSVRYLVIEIHNVEGRNPEQVVRAIQAQGFREIPIEERCAEDVRLFERDDEASASNPSLPLGRKASETA